ncbi:Luciferase-like monooxygenase [Thermobaculum terrenum ATCC BAA-798]|uniref:Luciferase-like monooxygenase n=1 Tax=Thermobaculum terrenum (strain ATCC BAA-798 / CCMEE 7001 / YNP1) TaxID=525904 RepID=D1CCE3_THET1|nr:LLM class flavin-dependent oxidoreductase [Thermobaculum terrenum]ACZ42458.1 Luciferase-like monooxygenase [Thermobaculum terrenum ATCC BAA-798]
MRFGVNIPAFDQLSNPKEIARLARMAEDSGWNGFFIWDDLIRDNGPCGDTTVCLAAIAMSTTKISFGPMVIALPRRHPWKVAREAVSLDILSDGRLILGIGLGDPPESYERLGQIGDIKYRARWTDEALRVIELLWRGEETNFRGEYLRVDGVRFTPVPIQKPRIPIWIGGWWPNKGPMRRAAKWDGAIPGKWEQILSPQEAAEIRDFIASNRADSTSFDLAVSGITPHDDHNKAAEIVRPYIEVGVTWWIEDLGPTRFGTSWEIKPEQITEIEARIVAGPPRI